MVLIFPSGSHAEIFPKLHLFIQRRIPTTLFQWYHDITNLDMADTDCVHEQKISVPYDFFHSLMSLFHAREGSAVPEWDIFGMNEIHR